VVHAWGVAAPARKVAPRQAYSADAADRRELEAAIQKLVPNQQRAEELRKRALLGEEQEKRKEPLTSRQSDHREATRERNNEGAPSLRSRRAEHSPWDPEDIAHARPSLHRARRTVVGAREQALIPRATLPWMIRDLAAYERLRVADEHRALRELDDDEGIAMAEALLTSSVLARGDRGSDPRPLDLVRTLGIDPRRVVRVVKPTTW
jgi:hypothetical protein